MGSSQHDIDPAGDLVLLVGVDEDSKLLRVSSRVLTLASPVLSALLSPRFKEGNSLAGSTGLPQIPFPEDNPEAMEWLCQALHFKIKVTDVVSFPLVKNLAVLCDKYDLSIALGPWNEHLMQTWRGSVDGVDRHPQLLWVSYALDNQYRFWKTSKELLRLYTSDDLVLAGNELANNILPDRVFESINNDREKGLLQLQSAIEESIVSFVEKGCQNKVYHESNGQPCFKLAEAGHCLSELIRLGLWPMSRSLPNANLDDVPQVASDFKNYSRSLYRYAPTCALDNTDFKAMLGQMVADATEVLQGLCLKCVKQGKVTEEEGNCHAADVHLCKS